MFAATQRRVVPQLFSVLGRDKTLELLSEARILISSLTNGERLNLLCKSDALAPNRAAAYFECVLSGATECLSIPSLDGRIRVGVELAEMASFTYSIGNCIRRGFLP